MFNIDEYLICVINREEWNVCVCVKIKSDEIITSTFVTNGPTDEVTTLGDGDSDFGFNSGGLGHVGEQNGAEAFRIFAYFLHLNATGLQNGDVRVLCRGGAGHQLHGLIVRRRSRALPASVCCSDGQKKNHSGDAQLFS